MLDTAWEGSPGARAIADGIAGNLKGRWCEYAVVVIDPELEAWIWQDNPHVSRGLGHTNAQQSLRALLAASGEWPNGHDKPPRPKEVVERVLRSNRIPRSAAIYRQIAGRVSVNACTDQAFQALIQTLRGWFPTDVA
jgi:hypothetical protein